MATIAERIKSAKQSSGNSRVVELLRPQLQTSIAEKERRRREELAIKQNEAIAAFNARQQEVQDGGIFKKTTSFIKEQTGYGDTLPLIEGASPGYSAQQQALELSRAYKDEVLGRLSIGATDLFGKAKDAASKRFDEYVKSVQERGLEKTQQDLKIGAVKNTAELASGATKLALSLTSVGGYSGIRKVISFVGGKQVEQFLDRATPEYMQAAGARLDENGILNYHPEYANEIQKTGGEVAEIGSWFIPITRLAKVEKGASAIAGALKEIPQVSKILGVTPRLVKVGNRFAYEVSKDVVDVATLDAIRGKNWETIKEDAAMAGAGGAVIRGAIGGVKGVGTIADMLHAGKENKLIKTVEDSFGKLNDDERVIAQTMIREGKPVDDIVTDIAIKREQSSQIDIPVQETTEQMEFQGFRDAGIAKINEIPSFKPEKTTVNKSDLPGAPSKLTPYEGTGETKQRGLAVSLNQRLKEAGHAELDDIPEYKSVNFAEHDKKAAELFETDREKLIRVATGEEHVDGLIPERALRAIELSGDEALIADVVNRTSLIEEATTMGQRIAALADRNPDGVIAVLSKTTKERTSKAVKTKIEKDVKKMKKDIDSVKLKVSTAQKLLDKLIC